MVAKQDLFADMVNKEPVDSNSEIAMGFNKGSQSKVGVKLNLVDVVQETEAMQVGVKKLSRR